MSRFFRVNMFALGVMMASLSGCLGTRFLKEDEKLLYKQKIEGVSREERRELENLYQQRPNRKFPLIPWNPYVWFHQLGVNSYDTARYERKKEKIERKYQKKIEGKDPQSKYVSRKRLKKNKKIARQNRNIDEGNLLMRWGEPVAIYRKELRDETISQFQTYMQSKGYFETSISSEVKTLAKLNRVFYRIEPGTPYLLDSMFYTIEDTAIARLVDRAALNNLLIKGEKYDQDIIAEERERLFNLVVNNGYYDFSRQYISFQIDTATLADRKVMINQVISQRNDGNNHKVFTVDSVNFVTDANINLPGQQRKRKKYRGVNYRFYEDKYNRRIIDWRLFIHEDSLFRRENTLKTQRQLANLDMFKFINVNYDTTGRQFVANVFVSPLEKYQTSGEIGVNVSQGLPGPFINGSIKNRNVFGGLETFEFSGRFGIEGVAAASNETELYQSTEFGFNASMLFPQFLFPMSKKWEEKVRNYEPKTNTLAGLTFTQRPEYDRNSLTGSITYSWVNKREKIYSFSPAEITFINSDILSDDFQEFLEELERQGNNLINTFEPSFVSAMTFSVINNFNQYGNLTESSSFLRYSAESGGAWLNFVDEDDLISDNLEFYSYLKFTGDFRRHAPLNINNALAFRVNAGLAVPYGDNKILPYEKYFFAGGSNGIRAWRPRRLGPGSYTPLDSLGNFTDSFEQSGEILLEASFEVRHNLLGFIDGAAFLDIGNIWTLREDPSREGAQFQFNRFFREIAIGTGYGVRLDFSFLLLRFDAGVKIYDPARDEGSRFVWSDGFNDDKFRASDTIIFNIGIGYPF